jgi:hypothetical protein
MKPIKLLVAVGLIWGLLAVTCNAQPPYNPSDSLDQRKERERTYQQGNAEGRRPGRNDAETTQNSQENPHHPYHSWQKEQYLKSLSSDNTNTPGAPTSGGGGVGQPPSPANEGRRDSK